VLAAGAPQLMRLALPMVEQVAEALQHLMPWCTVVQMTRFYDKGVQWGDVETTFRRSGRAEKRAREDEAQQGGQPRRVKTD